MAAFACPSAPVGHQVQALQAHIRTWLVGARCTPMQAHRRYVVRVQAALIARCAPALHRYTALHMEHAAHATSYHTPLLATSYRQAIAMRTACHQAAIDLCIGKAYHNVAMAWTLSMGIGRGARAKAIGLSALYQICYACVVVLMPR